MDACVWYCLRWALQLSMSLARLYCCSRRSVVAQSSHLQNQRCLQTVVNDRYTNRRQPLVKLHQKFQKTSLSNFENLLPSFCTLVFFAFFCQSQKEFCVCGQVPES